MEREDACNEKLYYIGPFQQEEDGRGGSLTMAFVRAPFKSAVFVHAVHAPHS